MISLKFADIPPYLQPSAFYRSLDGEDCSSTIEIPAHAFKQNPTVTSRPDLVQLLHTMHFWMLEQIPESLLQYCLESQMNSCVLADVVEGSSVMSDLRTVFHRPTGDTREGILCRAIETGRMEIVAYLLKSDINNTLDCTAMTCAAKRGDVQMLAFLYEHTLLWDCTTTDAAALDGHLGCLEYAHTHGCTLDTSALTAAATGGHMDCVQYIIRAGVAWHRDVCTTAAERGHLHILSYAYEHDCPWDDIVTENAAKYGHLLCLQYALERGCAVSEDAVYKSSGHGHLECLSCLYDCEAPFDDIATALAASNGHLDCVIFLIERGFGHTARSTLTAASCGHLHVLRYLLDSGVPYIFTLLSFAANAPHNSLPCLRYLIEEQGLHMSENGSIFGTAFMRADVECVQYLITIGCPYMKFKFRDFSSGDIVDVKQFDLRMVKCIDCALLHGWKFDIALYKAACKHKLMECKQYLEHEGYGVVEEEPEEVDLCGCGLFD